MKCANCRKEIETDTVFCNDDEKRICQKCWDNGESEIDESEA